jgi:hypothetical protein
VTQGGVPRTYSGTPNPADFDVVLLLVDNDYSSDMPLAGQTALRDWVLAGGRLLMSTWACYHFRNGRYTTLRTIGLWEYGSGVEPNVTYRVENSTHPITQGLPATWSGLGGVTTSYTPLNGGGTVLVTANSGTWPGVALGSFGSGTVVQVNNAGTYNGYDAWNDVNFDRLLINTMDYFMTL